MALKPLQVAFCLAAYTPWHLWVVAFEVVAVKNVHDASSGAVIVESM